MNVGFGALEIAVETDRVEVEELGRVDPFDKDERKDSLREKVVGEIEEVRERGTAGGLCGGETLRGGTMLRYDA